MTEAHPSLAQMPPPLPPLAACILHVCMLAGVSMCQHLQACMLLQVCVFPPTGTMDRWVEVGQGCLLAWRLGHVHVVGVPFHPRCTNV